MQNWDAGILKIDQSAFIYNLLKKENLTDCNTINIPMKARNFIEMLKEDDYEKTNIKVYQYLIGKLMYTSCGTRPDITFVVGQFSKQNADPKVGHLKAAKQVLRYFKDIMHLRITYGASEIKLSPYCLTGYADSNYAGDPEDYKSVIGYCFFINRDIISWWSKKQQIVSTSTSKAEYITLGHIVQKNVWIKQFLNELKIADPIDACIL